MAFDLYRCHVHFLLLYYLFRVLVPRRHLVYYVNYKYEWMMPSKAPFVYYWIETELSLYIFVYGSSRSLTSSQDSIHSALLLSFTCPLCAILCGIDDGQATHTLTRLIITYRFKMLFHLFSVIYLSFKLFTSVDSVRFEHWQCYDRIGGYC